MASFLKKHRALIKSVGRKYRIPNRYDIEDIEEYIAERMLTILKARQGPDSKNPILDREKYFLNCIGFYCIEYQRQNGFIFCLPKRPRKNALEDEFEAKSRDFSYLNDSMMYDSSLILNFEEDLSDPGATSSSWTMLTGFLQGPDADVVDCIHRRDMTLAETSDHLGIAQSTCFTRRDRAYRHLFEALDNMSGKIYENLKRIIRFPRTPND
ncbi:MAG: hypothetical protein ACXABY_00080 [Candidatus Thorarchaeota archaeon]